ncbi:MAG: ATP-binding cassette domain-containing protein [Candidatus Poribacteria bacterium]|nr:ATP-binding cassette domain-containing protein [Candidatus Poribacteria bacterium]
MIQVHQVSFSYDELSVLEKVSFRVERGEFVFLVGPSGSGKTTLLRLLYADLLPVAGDLSVIGQKLATLDKVSLPYFRQKIGLVFQDFKFLVDKTIQENLALPQKLVGMAPRVAKENVNKLLHQIGLSHHQHARPTEISSNERRRLAIARAVINNPVLLLADAPTEGLDVRLSLEVMALLDALNFQGMTIFVATSDRELAEKCNKRIIELRDGGIH